MADTQNTGGLAIISEAVDDSGKQEMISADHPAYYDAISRIGDNWRPAGIVLLLHESAV